GQPPRPGRAPRVGPDLRPGRAPAAGRRRRARTAPRQPVFGPAPGPPRAAARAGRRPLGGVGEPDLHRASPYEVRRKAQQARLGLPPLPTTTIGSFPHTRAVPNGTEGRPRRG